MVFKKKIREPEAEQKNNSLALVSNEGALPSAEEPKDNPTPAPVSEHLLVEKPAEATDYIVPIAIALGGAVLWYKTSKAKEKNRKARNKAATPPEPNRDQVTFSEDSSNYMIGPDWKEITLEPYLAEQAEENNLITESLREPDSSDSFQHLMEESRNNVVSAFFATHRVNTPSGEMTISELPEGPKVQEFKDHVKQEVKRFQGDY